MKHYPLILLAWLTIWTGCGESAQEKLARSPEVQRKLREIDEKNRALRQKRQQLIDKARHTKTETGALLEKTPGTSSEKPDVDSPQPDDQPKSTLDQPPEGLRTSVTRGLSAWRKLRAGLPRQIVRQLLGSPTVTRRDVFLEYWYYGQGPRAGKVSFVIGSGKALGWDPPLQP